MGGININSIVFPTVTVKIDIDNYHDRDLIQTGNKIVDTINNSKKSAIGDNAWSIIDAIQQMKEDGNASKDGLEHLERLTRELLFGEEYIIPEKEKVAYDWGASSGMISPPVKPMFAKKDMENIYQQTILNVDAKNNWTIFDPIEKYKDE